MASVYEKKKLKEKMAAAERSVGSTGLAGVSRETWRQLENARQDGTPSAQTRAAGQAYQQIRQEKPQTYVSAYGQQLNDLYDRIVNRPAFTYDPQRDPVYQQYAQEYTRQGKRAMADAQGQAAALTGGYGSSYAAAAGNQAYQEQLAHLNEALPQLYREARSRYDAQGQELKDLYTLTREQDEQAYGRWTDAYQRWQTERDQAYSVYEDQRNDDRQRQQAQLDHWQEAAQAENSDYRKGQSRAYDLALEMIKAGQTPEDSLLWQAGLSVGDAAVLRSMYSPKKAKSSKKKTTIQLAQPLPVYQA